MAHENPGQTLQATVLVHEAWLRLGDQDIQAWSGRPHFFGAAAEAMRRILIDNARRKRAVRHGGGQLRVDLQEVEIEMAVKDDDLLEVNAALERLAVILFQKTGARRIALTTIPLSPGSGSLSRLNLCDPSCAHFLSSGFYQRHGLLKEGAGQFDQIRPAVRRSVP